MADRPLASSTAILERRLHELSTEQARLLYLSAVPLWLDPELLLTIYDDRAVATNALHLLEQELWLTQVTPTRAVLRASVRRYLLHAGWQGRLPDYADINLRVAHYCHQQLLPHDKDEHQFRWARSVMYHLLVAGEDTGWEWLAQLFDNAEARGLVGSTEQILEPLKELRPLLFPDERTTLSYYRARVALQSRKLRTAERLFCAVIERNESTVLTGAAQRGLGETFAARQHWASGLYYLEQSIATLQHANAQTTDGVQLGLLRSWLTLACTYQDLADFSGGIVHPEESGNRSALRLHHKIIYGPIELYRRLGRRIQRLPLIDIGFDYQNWLIARLLAQAATSYAQAERLLATVPSPQATFESQVGLARIYLQVGMLRAAHSILAKLADWRYVQESEYRQAVVDYWQGELAYQQDAPAQAIALFQRAIAIFTDYQQLYQAAGAYARLGRLLTADPAAEPALRATTAYANAAAFYAKIRQWQPRTAVINQWRRLDPTFQESALTNEPMAAQGDNHQDALPPHEYLARFPQRLAGRYRQLAFFTITFLLGLTFLLSLIDFIILSISEAKFVQGVFTLLTLLVLLTAPILSLWLFQVAYLVFGLLTSAWLPLRFLERDPPLSITLETEGLTIVGLGQGAQERRKVHLPWALIKTLQVVDYQVQSQRIELISYIDILADRQRWRIPALTLDYTWLLQDLQAFTRHAHWQWATFRLLPRSSVYGGVLLVALLGGVAFQRAADFGLTNPQQPDDWTLTMFSGVLLGALITLFLLLPLLTFWRLLFHHWMLWRHTPSQVARPPFTLGTILTYLGALLWTLLSFFYLQYLFRFLLS